MNYRTCNICHLSLDELEFKPITNVSQFCRENNLNLNCIFRVLHKKRNFHKGWTIPKE